MVQNRQNQRGFAATAVAMVLLFTMTVLAFFTGRSMLFEQRTSANQTRATRAFEAADAGIEWAIGRLNDRRVMANAATTCVPVGTAGSSFRDRYVPSSVAAGVTTFNPTADRPGCTITAAGVNCNCPAAGNAALNGNNPTFTVTFDNNGISDPESVRITSYGCTSAGSQCVPGAATAADGYSRITIVAKVRPVVRSAPAAALTTGGWAQVCSSFNISNVDQGSNGNLVNSGGAIELGTDYGSIAQNAPSGPPPNGNCGGHVTVDCSNNQALCLSTVPGTPYQNAVVSNDSSLSSLSGNSDAMFSAFFGMTIAAYKSAPTTYVITSNNGSTNASILQNAYALGYTSFWIEGPLTISNNTVLGTTAKPVMIASSGTLSLPNGNSTIVGLVYSDNADFNQNGSGNSTITGAVITRVNYTNNGNGSITYDPSVFRNLRDDSGVFVRVPGSWRDF